LEEERLTSLRSRWDTLIASPSVEPVIKGSYRLHNGWDFETYDRNCRSDHHDSRGTRSIRVDYDNNITENKKWKF
jgi:hypothetical protein